MAQLRAIRPHEVKTGVFALIPNGGMERVGEKLAVIVDVHRELKRAQVAIWDPSCRAWAISLDTYPTHVFRRIPEGDPRALIAQLARDFGSDEDLIDEDPEDDEGALPDPKEEAALVEDDHYLDSIGGE